MTIRHHIPDDMLFLYASGDLPHLWSLGVATHLSYCPKCVARLGSYEEILGNALETESIESVVHNDVSSLISAANSGSDESHGEDGVTVALSKPAVFPRPLRERCGDLDSIKWSNVGGGVKQHLFEQDGAYTARLLYIPANVAVPAHGHGGVELTQVLVGGFHDANQAFNRGDIQVVAHESPHQPIAMADQACVCLAITDAPLRFRNLLPRLFQPFFKI